LQVYVTVVTEKEDLYNKMPESLASVIY